MRRYTVPPGAYHDAFFLTAGEGSEAAADSIAAHADGCVCTMSGGQPDPLVLVYQRRRQSSDRLRVHQAIKNLAAVLPDLRMGVLQPVQRRPPGGLAEAQKLPVSREAAACVRKHADELTGGEVIGQLDQMHAPKHGSRTGQAQPNTRPIRR